jgi:RNA polymerase sigma-70 factor (ECF subfamily)
VSGYALPRSDTSLGAQETVVGADPLSFAEVFAAQGAYVLPLLGRLGVDAADVEDVAQEVFLAIHKNLPTFEGRSRIKTWVCGICLRKAAQYRRKRHRLREKVGDAIPERPTDEDPEQRLERRQDAALLRAALTQLPDKQREVFVLFEIEELSMADVAQAVGCPRFTAYTRLYAARQALRALIDPLSGGGNAP